MWTYSGMFIVKEKDRYELYTSNEEEMNIFGDGHGCLDPFFDPYKERMNKDGIYQVHTGYGSVHDIQDPGFYWIKYIGDIDWGVPTDSVESKKIC